jgi:hypothetical protein
MKYDDFSDGLKKMMHSQGYLHHAMIEDFYNLGKVLNKKFWYLRICYNVFMYGIIGSVLAFIIASFKEELKLIFSF